MTDYVNFTIEGTHRRALINDVLIQHLAFLMYYDNLVHMTKKEMIAELGVSRPTFDNMINRAIEAKLIVKVRRASYMVDPTVATLLSPESKEHNKLVQEFNRLVVGNERD